MAADTETLTAPALTPERLAELERLHAAATKGPWVAETAADGGWEIGSAPDAMPVVCARFSWSHRADESRANAALIVELRNSAPALIASARRTQQAEADVERLSPLGKTSEYRRILDLTDERDILAGKLKKAEERDAGQGQELMNLSEKLYAARAERDAALRAQQIAERDAAAMKEHAQGWRKEADQHLTEQAEQVAKRRAAEAERDAALKRAEDLRAEREQTTNLIEAVERWAAARRRERGHYDLKGDLQMEIRQCERDLEDAYAATLSQPGATS